MGVFTGSKSQVRVLGLGNELLADDAFGILAVREVRRRLGSEIDVVESSDAGFNLLDRLLGVPYLLVIDCVITGKAKPGTLHVSNACDWPPTPGLSPHFAGIFEVLAVAGKLGLKVPRETTVLAVEAADCSTVGGPMHAEVSAAIPRAVNWTADFLKGKSCAPAHSG